MVLGIQLPCKVMLEAGKRFGFNTKNKEMPPQKVSVVVQ